MDLRREALLAGLGLIFVFSVSCTGTVTSNQAGIDDRGRVLPVCYQDNADTECALCVDDTDCDEGDYCGPFARCMSPCSSTPTDSCVGGTVCKAGRCVFDEGPGCGEVEVNLTAVIPDVLLLLDRSGSMILYEFDGVLRWDAVRYALTDPDDGVVTALENTVRFSAVSYNSDDGFGPDNDRVCPILTPLPVSRPAFGMRNSIDQLFNTRPESGYVDTPTGESVAEVSSIMAAWRPLPGQKNQRKILVLATDGFPDTCASPDGHDDAAKVMSERAIQQAYASGITTYVLSVGRSIAESHLSRMANAGVGKPLSPPSAPFFVGNSTQELIEAFQEILGKARDCSFAVDGDVNLDRASTGRVILNSRELTWNVDWRMRNASTLQLLGDACQAFLSEEEVALSATFPCGVVIK